MINISIVSIGKNCASLVAGTISSVLSQKLNGVQIEYIVVDGLSSDSTLDEVARATKDDLRVRVISEADRGISDAMNKGARLARGQLIFHLHFGDVLFDDDVIAKVWDDFQRNDWRWAAGTLAISKDGSDVETISFKPGCVSDLIKKNCVPHQATFITRELFLQAGGFDVDMKQAMDYDLWLRLAHLHKEWLHILPFTVAKFDSSGESTKLLPLLKGNAVARTKMIRQYGTRTTLLTELLFLFAHHCLLDVLPRKHAVEGSPLKNILIDARWLTNSIRGIGVFTHSLIRALKIKNLGNFEFYLAVRKKYASSVASALPDNFHIVQLPDWCPDPILDLVFFSYLAKKVSADVVHFTGNTGFILPQMRARVLLTLHDVSFLKSAAVVPFPRQNLRQAIGRLYRKALVPFYAKRASKVCTVSEFAVRDIQHELGIRAEFIYHGFELPVGTGLSDNHAAVNDGGKSSDPTYLAITGADPQKNLSLVIAAFVSLYKKHKTEAPKLAVIGVNREQYERLKPDVSITDNVSFLGMCPHREIPGHIQSCKALIVPSFYESFGLPVIESLFFHKASLCSSGGALPEIGSAFAHYFDPHDQDTLVKLIEEVETGKLVIDLPAEQVDQYLERFSWSKVANFYLNLYAASDFTRDREMALL